MDHISGSMQSLSIYDYEDLAELEEILNYEFNNRSLLEEALTHSSMNSTKSYERLEFLGDSVLGYLITKHLHWTYPKLDQGSLSRLRSGNVDTEKFARVSVRHKFHQFLRMKRSPELQLNIDNFVEAIKDETESKSFRYGDFNPPKFLADIVESIAGAVLVDSGHSVDTVWEVFMPLLEPLVTLETLEQHPVTELQELCQKHGKHMEYRYPPKGGKVRVEVLIDGKVVGSGEDQKKELAQRAAAKHALDELKELWEEEDRVESARIREKHSTCYLHNFCRKNKWPSPFYRFLQEKGPLPTKRFVCGVSICTENGWTPECVGDPMPRKKEAKRSAANAILNDFT